MKYKKVLEMDSRKDDQNLIFSLLILVLFLTSMLCECNAACTSLLTKLRVKILPSISHVTNKFLKIQILKMNLRSLINYWKAEKYIVLHFIVIKSSISLRTCAIILKENNKLKVTNENLK